MAVFLLLSLVQPLVAPFLALAFTGPHQPEYTSYESADATDMVNLLTGDFSFNVPILEVPGPEGSFSLPLSYHAGIEVDQEASWVGLGWSLNAGAITRSINEYPDDANGEYQMVTMQDLTGIHGWYASNLLLGSIGWNSQSGHHGSLSLLGVISAEWSGGSTAVGVAGINISDKDIRFDAVQFTATVVTALSWGAASAAAGGGKDGATAIMKQAAISAATSVAFSAALSFAQGSLSSPFAGHWKYSKKEKKIWAVKILTGFTTNVGKYRFWLDKTRVEDMYGVLYLGNAPTEALPSSSGNFASVAVNNGGVEESMRYFSKSTTGVSGYIYNQGAASDISYYGNEYADFRSSNTPAILGVDNFSVKGPGISGSIAPYRLDVGSVSMPREMTQVHTRLAPVRYLPNDGTTTSSYKVPFRYNGQYSGSYIHNVGGETTVSSPAFYSGMGWTVVDQGSSNPKKLRYDFDDIVLKDQRISNDLVSSKEIPAGRHIEWMTNQEIRSARTYSSGFLDFLSAGEGESVNENSDRFNYRVSSLTNSVLVSTSHFSTTIANVPTSFVSLNNIDEETLLDFTIILYGSEEDRTNGNALETFQVSNVPVTGLTTTGPTTTSIETDPYGPLSGYNGYIADIEIAISQPQRFVSRQTGIGGFTITKEDGISYHFALPIYDKGSQFEIIDVADPNKRSLIKRSDVFANAWLLTAVTGPDFIDRNENGMADEQDWGHWVKFHYGLHSQNYAWRIPYEGYRVDPAGQTKSYQHAISQLIYLNAIETRSHIALFEKSLRADGKSAEIYSNYPHVSYPLKLDEISLLRKEDYLKLTGEFGMLDFTDKLDFVLTTGAISTAGKEYVLKNAIRRIIFSYNYQLSRGIPNTSNPVPNNGRLTLERVAIVGRNGVKLFPDYKFHYDSNPAYDNGDADGFGMYTGNPAAWSLTRVVTPPGSVININYESDDYAYVGGESVDLRYEYNNVLSGNTTDPRLIIVDHEGTLKPGDQIEMRGYARWTCDVGGEVSWDFNDIYTITNVVGNNVYLSETFNGYEHCSDIMFYDFLGSIKRKYQRKAGGGIRVAAIEQLDEFGNGNKIRYLYDDGNGNSSGAISKEPSFVSKQIYDMSPPGYPITPVIYGKVTVLSGRLSDDSDYHTRQVYEFETPEVSQYSLATSTLANEQLVNRFTVNSGNNLPEDFEDYLSVFFNTIEDKTSRIGAIKSVKVFDKEGTEVSSDVFEYTEEMLNDGVNNFQGIYSKSTMLSDMTFDNVLSVFHKLNRTTVIEYPYVVKKVVSTKNGFATESSNLSWDLITGAVDQKLQKSNLGLYIKSVTTPAYKKYGAMGSKAITSSNKNMLSQVAATYTFKSNAVGDNLGLISAEVQTWKSDWNNYRVYSNGVYQDDPASLEYPVWRKAASYVWKGNYGLLREDGTQTFTSANDFNFQSPSQNSLWQYTGEVLRYDHYSGPLESKDLNNIYSASKIGYDNRILIASAINAQYHEIAFSSAEDLSHDGMVFGGEVALADGVVKYQSKAQTGSAHTGDAVVAVSTGKSFVFKTSALNATTRYRASVWANSSDGRIYYKVGAGNEVISTSQKISGPVNGWYRIDLLLPVQSYAGLEIGVRSATGSEICFDDFRFQPAEAVMTCYVYNPLDFQYTSTSPGFSEFTYVLDNDNLYTKYQHDERDQLKRVYRESIRYGVQLITENRENFRRFAVPD